MFRKLAWKSFSGGNFSPKAFRGGFNGDDNLLVIRANVDGGLIPGKFHVSRRVVSWVKKIKKDQVIYLN